MNHFVIGICGGTGSGKTTLAKKLCNEFEEDALLISMDLYYKNNTHLSLEERAQMNYDSPDAFEMELLLRQLDALKNGDPVDLPQYDYTIHLRKEETTRAESKKLIILEGILLFADEELRNRMDMKVFVDTDADIRILRRAIRDVRDRARTLDSVRAQYLATVKPMHEKYVEPSKKFADIIIPEGGKNQIAFETVRDTIRARI